MLAEVGQNQEQSNNIEFLVDSGAACHAWPFKTKYGSSRGGTFLTATGASQGTLDVSFQLVDVHGVEINVRATFELLPVRRPILSVSRLVEKGLAVVMGKEQGNTLRKDGRVIHLHKSNGVYHVRATALPELCPLEDQDPRNDDAHQQKRLVKRTCHGHEDCHTNQQRTRGWHIRLPTCHSELGVCTV